MEVTISNAVSGTWTPQNTPDESYKESVHFDFMDCSGVMKMAIFVEDYLSKNRPTFTCGNRVLVKDPDV